jgi:hypothetical protein
MELSGFEPLTSWKASVVVHTPKKETGCPLLGFGLDRGIGGFGGVWGATLSDPLRPYRASTPAGPLKSPSGLR